MKHFSVSRLSRLDVRWVNVCGANKALEHIHRNPYYELITVTQGPAYLSVGDERLTLNPGESLLLEPWEPHRSWRESNPLHFFWVQFGCDPAPQPFDIKENVPAKQTAFHGDLRTNEDMEVEGLIIPRRMQASQPYELFRMYEKLLQEFNYPQGNYRFRLTMLLGQMLEMLSRDVLQRSGLNQPLNSSYMTYRKLVNMLDEHYDTNITSQMIESAFDRTYEYLSQLFKRYSGITIVHYINRLRIQLASHLLNTTSKSANEIALEVGFQDTVYFRKVFKKMTGVTPSRLRERSRSLGVPEQDE